MPVAKSARLSVVSETAGWTAHPAAPWSDVVVSVAAEALAVSESTVSLKFLCSTWTRMVKMNDSTGKRGVGWM